MKKIIVITVLVLISIAAKLPKTSKAEIARKGFSAAINKDAEAFVNMCDENVVISFHTDDSDAPKSVFKGKEGAKAFMERRNNFEVYNFTNMQFKELGEKVIITGRFEGKLIGNETYTKEYVGVAVFKGDKVLYYYAF
jgi:ketosteroid isomerase-like protein